MSKRFNPGVCTNSAHDASLGFATQVPLPSEGGATALPYTGERIVPRKVPESLFREHEARYVFAGRFVEGRDVLDVACGTGIGTAYLLKAGARSCIGLDIDKSAVDYARAAYKGCSFMQSDAMDLDLQDESVDVVVSFETIEHVDDQRRFLEESRRVLRPGGLLICSTPNRAISRWREHNPFHVRELRVAEFRRLVEGTFGNAKMYAQEVKLLPVYVCRIVLLRMLERLGVKGAFKKVIGYKSSPLTLRNEFCKDLSKDGEIAVHKSSELAQPSYVIAVAARGGR